MSLPVWLLAFGEHDQAHLEDVSQNGAAITPANASAQFRISSDGKVYTAPTSGVFVERFTWLTGQGTNADYEAKFEQTSGSFSGGTFGTWVALTSSNTTGCVRTSDTPGTDQAVGEVQIRRASDQKLLATANFTLNATVAGA